MVMIDRMYVLEEKLGLDADRKYHAEHPGKWDSGAWMLSVNYFPVKESWRIVPKYPNYLT